jgi:tRNA guanosine-2'-O-methyltransferase
LDFFFNSSYFSQKSNSHLIVVASLINRAPNLGGLARTCEVFSSENYVIESLKLIENLEFKALSKTAEKWMKISEVKQWQLFDYLLGMKQKGYTIIGAEQSGESVSLINTKIPRKSVMLLG